MTRKPVTPPTDPERLTAEEFAERYSGAKVELVDGKVHISGVHILPEPTAHGPRLVVLDKQPSSPWTDCFKKVAEYLNAGARVIVVLDPDTTAAAVYRNDAPPRNFYKDDTLELPDVLPGFSVPVNCLFA